MMSIPYFDAHCDTVTTLAFNGGRLKRNDLHVDLARLSAFSPCAQVFAICTIFEADMANGYEADMLAFERELQENSDILALCRSADDAREAEKSGKIAAFLAVEGAEQIHCDTDGLLSAYERGIRLINITWNFDNALSGAAMGEQKDGLTAAGREYIRRAQELGILCDMSHISDAAFRDVMETTTRPIIAGHSNSRALCHHPRNITDEQFCALMATGGGAGLNLCPDFLGLSRDVDAVLAHAERWLSLGGERAVFLGCDFDGIDETPRGISGVQDMEILWEAMLRRGWSEGLVRGIFHDNLMNILERAL